MNIIRSFIVISAFLLTGCVGGIADRLGAWQDARFVSSAPTQAQIQFAMNYVGAGDLPLPIVRQATVHQQEVVGEALRSTVVSYQITGTNVIVVAPDWEIKGQETGEAYLIHEAYNYARSYRNLPVDDCGAYHVEHQYEEATGQYGIEHVSQMGAKGMGCYKGESAFFPAAGE